jgi:quercetin dioxygenase-like cupin family protein
MDMKKSMAATAAAVIAIAGTAGVAGSALATGPSPGIARTNLTPFPPGSLLAGKWKVNADKIKFQTKGDSRVVFQTVTYEPAADSGWHLHPGIVFVAVTAGEVTRWVGCTSHVYSAGQTFIESGQQPAGKVVNSGSTQAALVVMYVVPDGDSLADASPPAPVCTGGPGDDDDD